MSPVSRKASQRSHAPAGETGLLSAGSPLACILVVILLACTAVPSAAAGGLDTANSSRNSAGPATTGPQIVHIGTYVMDLNGYNDREGTFTTNYYSTLTSDLPVNTSDFEMMNGHADLVGLYTNTPTRKYFRVQGTLDTTPDFHRYPFDRDTLSIIIEPRLLNVTDMVLVIDEKETGLDSTAALPGWEIKNCQAYVTNYTYKDDENSYSRAIFACDISRDSFSTFLKFFLPVMLIVIVSLSSLLMRVTSRLGLNASMFLAAVLLHWRIADALPNIPYATFLDWFMILTYATLVMVLISGILAARFSELHDTERVERVNTWSIRIIPLVSIALYLILFLSLLS